MRFGQRFEAAIRRFDEENGRDPNKVTVGDVVHPRELLYAQRLTDWVRILTPEPSEALLLAARCQHLCRWTVPRASFEMTRLGYLKWRSSLKVFHAQKSGEILEETGYPPEMIQTVQALNLKKSQGIDPDYQVLEDALCLMTLQYQIDDLMAKTAEDKLVGILQKTWKKMSPAAHAHALKLPFSPEAAALIGRALA